MAVSRPMPCQLSQVEQRQLSERSAPVPLPPLLTESGKSTAERQHDSSFRPIWYCLSAARRPLQSARRTLHTPEMRWQRRAAMQSAQCVNPAARHSYARDQLKRVSFRTWSQTRRQKKPKGDKTPRNHQKQRGGGDYQPAGRVHVDAARVCPVGIHGAPHLIQDRDIRASAWR